jgi:predicted nuclease of predicted toxin-antitoxin system
MKFLVDAQLPLRLARRLQEVGYDTLHTQDLPLQNATPDVEINRISIQQQRIVITKDADFVNSFLTIQEPYKLLTITTGNISNTDLLTLVAANLPILVEQFEQHSYLELSREEIIVHF